MSRMAYIQMPFQAFRGEMLARSICLFGTDSTFGQPVLDSGWWEETTGVTLSQFLKIGFVMSMVGPWFEGSVSRQRLLADDFAPLFKPVDAGLALHVVDSWLASPIDDLVQMSRDNPTDPWIFNPLYERPIVLMDDDAYVVPSPRAVSQRLGPQGLYFLVLEATKTSGSRNEFQRFTSKLGVRFQNYVGKQLSIVRHAKIHPEITYGSSQQTVDHIIETPDVLVLVESKSAAPDRDTRSGIFPQGGDVDRKINYACEQITRTAELIQQGHPDLPPLDGRHLRGLVVTREDYYNLSLPRFRDVINPGPVPTTVVSSQELECVLSTLSDDEACGSSLLGSLASDTNAVKTDLEPLAFETNPMLKEVANQWGVEHGLQPLPSTPTQSATDNPRGSAHRSSESVDRFVGGVWLP